MGQDCPPKELVPSVPVFQTLGPQQAPTQAPPPAPFSVPRPACPSQASAAPGGVTGDADGRARRSLCLEAQLPGPHSQSCPCRDTRHPLQARRQVTTPLTSPWASQEGPRKLPLSCCCEAGDGAAGHTRPDSTTHTDAGGPRGGSTQAFLGVQGALDHTGLGAQPSLSVSHQ